MKRQIKIKANLGDSHLICHCEEVRRTDEAIYFSDSRIKNEFLTLSESKGR